MEEQTTQQPALTQQHSHTGIYTALTLSLAAATILLIVVIFLMGKRPTATQPQQALQNQPSQTTQAAPSSVQAQIQQVTPQPVATKQNLDSATQALDSTDMTQLTTGLNQNSQDTATFSQ